jgi:hypothetical protein
MSSQLSTALGTYPTSDLVTDFAEFATTHHVLPATFELTFEAALDRILEAAAEHGIRNTHALLSNYKLVLRTTTGVTNLTAHLRPAERARVHLHRNVLLTAVLGAAHTARIDLTGIRETVRPLTRRTQKTDRPLTDDEIALLRTHCATSLTTPASALAATVYTLCDAGAELREVTLVTPADIDSVSTPTLVYALGNRTVQARLLPLEGFHTRSLARRLASPQVTALKKPIAYNPRTNQAGSDQAMISAYGVTNRLLDAVGLRQPDVAPSSIRRWRIAHTHDTQGVAAAIQIAGCKPDAVLRLADREATRTQTSVRAAITRFGD